MALTLRIENTEVGHTFDAAYAKITSFHGMIPPDPDDETVVGFYVDFYATLEARQNNSRPIHRMNFHTSLPAGDFMPGLYNYLKSLPEFTGAEDA